MKKKSYKKICITGLLLATMLFTCACGSSQDTGKEKQEQKENTYLLVEKIDNDDENGGGKTFVFANENGILKFSGYDYMGSFYNNAAVVCRDNKESIYGEDYAIIDTDGKEIIPFGEYVSIYHLGDGQLVLDPLHLEEHNTLYDFFKVENENREYGIIDREGKEIVPCQYKYISSPCVEYYEDEDGDRVTILVFNGQNSDGTYDVYTEDGVKLMETVCNENARHSNIVGYSNCGNQPENDGVYRKNDNESKTEFVSEKTNEVILTIDRNKNDLVNTYEGGVISYGNEEAGMYETYLVSRDGTSVMKICDELAVKSLASDNYRIVWYSSERNGEYKDEVFVYDDNGKLCQTIPNNHNDSLFYAKGQGKDTQYFSKMDYEKWDIYDSNFEKIGECGNVYYIGNWFFTQENSAFKTCILYDESGKLLSEKAEIEWSQSDDSYVVKLEDGNCVYEYNGLIRKRPEGYTTEVSLNDGYFVVKNQVDGLYYIYNNDGKVSDLGDYEPSCIELVNIYEKDNQYYNYKGELIYEKQNKEE